MPAMRKRTGGACLLLTGTIAAAPFGHPNFVVGRGGVELQNFRASDKQPRFSEASSATMPLAGAALLGVATAAATAAAALTVRRGYGNTFGGGKPNGNFDAAAAKQKADRESAMFFSYQSRLSREGLPARDEYFWKGEERQCYGGMQMKSGIDFSKYAEVEVECRGGLGEEEPCESFQSISKDFELPEQLKANIERCGYKNPTPVQQYAMPASFMGTDVMVAAQTGSGKTAAFLVPLISRVLNEGINEMVEGPAKPLAIVLAPTRELCVQIAMEARKLCFRTDVRVASIYGGADAASQLRSLAEGGQLTIATPGRLEDFLQRGVVRMDDVRFMVLDEADRMLDMGFEPAIRSIIERYGMPAPGREAGSRQTMMFSATFPKEMQDMALDFLDPTYMWIGVGRIGAANDSVEQRFEDCTSMDERSKTSLLLEKLKDVEESPGLITRSLIFVNTKMSADSLIYQLADHKIKAAAIHGGLNQAQRETAIRDFKDGKIRALVGTDVAARGLDLPNVGHVINFDMPGNAEDYVHRIGRTGRIGNKGISTSFVGNNDGSIKDVVQMLEDQEAEIPEWLADASSRAGSARRRF